MGNQNSEVNGRRSVNAYRFKDIYSNKLKDTKISSTPKVDEQIIRKFTNSRSEVTTIICSDALGVINQIQSKYSKAENEIYSMHLKNLDIQSYDTLSIDDVLMFTGSKGIRHIDFAGMQETERLRTLMVVRDIVISTLYYDIDSFTSDYDIRDVNRIVFGNSTEYNSVLDILQALGRNTVYFAILGILGNKAFWPFNGHGLYLITSGMDYVKATQISSIMQSRLSNRQSKCIKAMYYIENIKNSTNIPERAALDSMIMMQKQLTNKYVQYKGD